MFLYIDATAGGLLIQLLLGGFAGIGVVGRLVWGRFGGRSDDDATDDPSASDSVAADAESADADSKAA